MAVEKYCQIKRSAARFLLPLRSESLNPVLHALVQQTLFIVSVHLLEITQKLFVSSGIEK